MTVSIIVPIHNTEKYLRRCVDSLIGQSHEDIEIVLVDDGSTDESGSICEEYAKSDARVKVIHQANGGESRARNTGIENATGEYLMFCDSDDEYLPHSAEILLGAMGEGVDMTLGGFLEISGGITRYASTGESPYTKSGLVSKTINDGRGYGANYIMSALQAKLFRRSIFEEGNLRAKPDFVVGNDSILIMDYLTLCGGIRDTFYPMYVYYKYDVSERVQGMAWYYPDEYRWLVEVWKRRVRILDIDERWNTEEREGFLGHTADILIRFLIRAAAFVECFPEGLTREIEWAANNKFVRECLDYYKPKRKTDSVMIPKHLKTGNIDAAYDEIRCKCEVWENRERFVGDRPYVRRMFSGDLPAPTPRIGGAHG
jgi:glycosyltransferase involved in cell wall biosynthesis